MAGHKADVQRCFDSVSFDQAFEVARWLGAPPSLLALLKAFYSRQERHVAWQGVYHHSPVAPVLGLLQGCPFSPLLLNCVCSLWVRVVKAAEPRASLAVYLDDRTVWRVGRQASQVVVAAARAGTTFDDFFDLCLHPEKLGSIATTARERAALQTEALVVGTVKTQFVLLGVPYTFGTTCLPDTTALTASVQRCCERVALAAASPACRELVLPLFARAGPGTHCKQTHVDTWTRAVALALWGHKTRSRLLLWHVVGRPRLRWIGPRCVRSGFAVLSRLLFAWVLTPSLRGGSLFNASGAGLPPLTVLGSLGSASCALVGMVSGVSGVSLTTPSFSRSGLWTPRAVSTTLLCPFRLLVLRGRAGPPCPAHCHGLCG